MGDRLILSISFNDIKSYRHVKNQPNSSYYIRKLVEEDIRRKQKEKDDHCENKVELDVNINDILDW